MLTPSERRRCLASKSILGILRRNLTGPLRRERQLIPRTARARPGPRALEVETAAPALAPGSFCELLPVHDPRTTSTMALWKSCALLFATLARRCALGADDDVNRDAVETYFDLDAYEDDYRYLDDEMTSNKVPYHTNAPVMVADTCATLTTMWRMAMSTTGSSRGGHGQGIVDEQEAGLTGTSNGEGSMLNPDVDTLLFVQSNGTSTRASADDLSYMLDLTRPKGISDDQHQHGTSNFAAGLTTPSLVPPQGSKVTCDHCGTEVSHTSLKRHQEHSCDTLKVRRWSHCPSSQVQ